MKNFFKRFITCSVAACIVAAAALAGACAPDNGGNENPGDKHLDPTKSGYVITLLYPDDTPVKGSDAPGSKSVAIYLVDEGGNDLAFSFVSDTGGATTINYKQSGEFLIDVANVPTGYEYADKVYTEPGRGDYTVRLSATTVSYTINVSLPDGTPATGVTVTLKQDGEIVESAVTNASGTAVISDVYAGNYDVEFTNLPEEDISYLPTKLTASSTTLNVKLIRLNELKLDEVMSDEKLNEWDELANSDLVTRFDRTADCYDFTTDIIHEGEKLYYYFTADEDGEYHFISRGRYYVIEFFGNEIGEVQHTTESVHESTNTCEMVQLTLKKGERYYFAYSIPARALDPDDEHELSGTREFMIAKPVAGINSYEIDATGSHTLSFDTDEVLLVFKTPENATPGVPLPTEGGVFEIRSDTNLYDVKIEFYAYYNGDDRAPDEVEDDISETDKNFLFTIVVPPSFAGNKYYFKIIIKSRLDGGEVEYPAEVPITVTRTGNAEENISPVEYQHATSTEKFPEQSGKSFHFLVGSGYSIRESDFNIVQRDGGYYVNIEGTDYELVVAISKTLPGLPYSYANVEYMGDNGTGDSDSDDTVANERQNNNLSLYSDPSKGEDKNNTKLNYTPFISEYAALCNSDGVYSLNSELKLFLERYYEHRWNDFAYILGFGGKDNCCWLLSCGYYA